MKTKRKLYELLVKNEIPPKPAKILACFEKDDERLTVWEIQVRARIQQPQVSTETRWLVKKGWLKISTISKPGKGRPYYEYYLAHPMSEICQRIADERMADLSKARQCIEDLIQMSA